MSIDRLPAWLRWVRAWYPRRPAWGGVVFACVLALAGCSAPLQHQQRLSVLHTQAARACTSQHLTCAALAPCSAAVRVALADWQAVSAAVSKGDDTAEAAALIIASTSELAAITACKGVR